MLGGGILNAWPADWELPWPAMVAGLCRTPALVQVIALQGNHLSALPSLPAALHTLSVSRNLFRKFPGTLCSLPSLTDLDLGRNQLQSVPPAISQLQSLKFLNLMNNQLESLPSEIGSLPSLYRLGLKSNKLTELPETIANLHSLVGGSLALRQQVFAMSGASTRWWWHQHLDPRKACHAVVIMHTAPCAAGAASTHVLHVMKCSHEHTLACSVCSALCRWSCSSQTTC